VKKHKWALYLAILYFVIDVFMIIALALMTKDGLKNDDLLLAFILIPLFILIGSFCYLYYYASKNNKLVILYVSRKKIGVSFLMFIILVIITAFISAIKFKYYVLFIPGLFYGSMYGFFYYFYKQLINDNDRFRNTKTNRYIGVGVDDSFYLNGVNVLDQSQNNEINNRKVILKIGKQEQYSDKVLYVKGKNFHFLVAYKDLGNNEKIIFVVRNKDLFKVNTKELNNYVDSDYNINMMGYINYFKKQEDIIYDPQFYYNKTRDYRFRIIEKDDNFFVIEALLMEWPVYDYFENKVSYWNIFNIDILDVDSYDEAINVGKKHLEQIDQKEILKDSEV